jgi:hypothetical protein
MTKKLRQAESQLEQAEAALVEAFRQENEAESEVANVKAREKDGDQPTEKSEKKKKKKKQDKKLGNALGSARGIETMFRSAYRVQMDLTGLADNKANMMISINGIIISIIIAAVAPKLDANPWLLIPSTLFLVGTLVSIVYAILAARPRVNTTPITLADLRHSGGNILFFGDFANMGEEEFVHGMVELVQDNTVVYETMMRNIYGLGTVLKTKFALLRMAYTTFMIALILGVISFIFVFVWILQLSA